MYNIVNKFHKSGKNFIKRSFKVITRFFIAYWCFSSYILHSCPHLHDSEGKKHLQEVFLNLPLVESTYHASSNK